MEGSRIFTKHGHTIKLDRDYGETKEQFVERGIFVISQFPKTENDYTNALKMSRIYRNVHNNNAGYSTKLLNRLEEMTKNMYEE